MDEPVVFTIGPNQPWENFLRFMKSLKIEFLDDVRSNISPDTDRHFRAPVLRSLLVDHTISYRRFTPQQAVRRAVIEARYKRIVLLCSEDERVQSCHYTTVSRMLSEAGLRAHHLQGDHRQVEVFTIGVTRHTAPDFFGALKEAGIKRLLDVRLNNWTQLAGFTKRDDLPFFLKELCGAEYVHEPLLAPSRDLLNSYKSLGGEWPQYERDFLALMTDRQVERQLSIALFDVPTVLLCYEAEADFCHRRLVLDYLQEKWGGLKITHL